VELSQKIPSTLQFFRQKQVYSVVKRPNIPVFGGKKPSLREGIKGMGILENAIMPEPIKLDHLKRICYDDF
jgi:hypothetical protein